MALPLKRQHVYSIEVAIACAATSRSIVAWPDDNYTHAEARCARKNLTQWTPDQRLEAHGCVSKDSDLRTMTQFPEQSITLETMQSGCFRSSSHYPVGCIAGKWARPWDRRACAQALRGVSRSRLVLHLTGGDHDTQRLRFVCFVYVDGGEWCCTTLKNSKWICVKMSPGCRLRMILVGLGLGGSM